MCPVCVILNYLTCLIDDGGRSLFKSFYYVINNLFNVALLLPCEFSDWQS